MTDDDIIHLIETFDFDAGPVAVERCNHGFTLIHAETGVPIARLHPIGRDDLVDILCQKITQRTNPQAHRKANRGNDRGKNSSDRSAVTTTLRISIP
jgi:hypothetical protein